MASGSYCLIQTSEFMDYRGVGYPKTFVIILCLSKYNKLSQNHLLHIFKNFPSFIILTENCSVIL